jgi:hypothetical protein
MAYLSSGQTETLEVTQREHTMIQISTSYGTIELSNETARWLEGSGSDLRASVESDAEVCRVVAPEAFMAYLIDGAEPDDLEAVSEYAAAIEALVS